MGLLDLFRRKKEIGNKTESKIEEDFPKMSISEEKVNEILKEEIKTFFPDKGVWYSNCFGRPSEVGYINLPCHLRDDDWMSKLLHKVLNNKGIYIPQHIIKKFMNDSKDFAELRHEYELRIVKWQIEFIQSGRGGWLMPKGYGDMALLFSEDVDKIIRGGVSKTLLAIGMENEVIEEGLEKYSDIWRPSSMRLGFEHLYEPVVYMVGTPGKIDEEHKKNWLANREYEYYQKHKHSVDNYGTLTPAMKMSVDEHIELVAVLKKQNATRKKVVKEWRAHALGGFYDKLNKKTSNAESQEEDTLRK